MTLAEVLVALQHNERYAKGIAHLAGLRTATTTGTAIDIAEQWDGHDFQPPIFLSIPLEVGRISWVHPDISPKIYTKTLAVIVDTFRQMTIPIHTVVMSVVISDQTKKPHFMKFVFRKEPFQIKPYDEIWLRHRSWNAEELEKAVRDLRKAKRRLKGIGYGE